MFSGLFIDAFAISPYVESVESEMIWSIAGPYQSPNIISELSFENVKSFGYGLRVAHLNKLTEKLALYIEVDYADASIESGDFQDSDYGGDNRTEEFSRSYSKVRNDANRNLAVSVGLKTPWFGSDRHYLSYLMGYQEQEIDTSITDGIQFIPEASRGAEIVGLDSTYSADFNSWFVGLVSEHRFSWGEIGLRYEYHDTEFKAEANWNLRSDFEHPRSFAQQAEGKGQELSIIYSYPVTIDWDIYINYSIQKREVERGANQFFFSSGARFISQLNKVEYDAKDIHIGFRYIF